MLVNIKVLKDEYFITNMPFLLFLLLKITKSIMVMTESGIKSMPCIKFALYIAIKTQPISVMAK